ncbi:MAG: ribosome-associated translation inhibitor RaiA [Erysipelotrichaceae bacterium]|nr:ribosome-associated translation inhibitor RaiA [Erysipelotrichaceae bacterium]MBR5755691.1 ribosome-associated translation inhibitor RaiA [Erysipelotrichaceae bacterium]
MKFTVYGENVTINDKMREKIENRLSDLNKYVVIDEQQNAKVTVKVHEGGLKVEVNVPSKIGLLRSEVVHEDFYTGIDLAIDKLEDQIRRQKGRLSRRHKESLAESFYEEPDENADIPVRTKTVYTEEMELDEAIMHMEMLSHSFFIYKDVDSEKLAVVYKRNDGGYGLIEVSE